MKRIVHLKTYVLSIGLIVAFCTISHAQVAVGTVTPNSSALLDLTNPPLPEAQGGLLIPRVALTTGTASPAPLAADVAGMIIFNTATVGDVTPGYYFNNGTDWERLSTGTGSIDWTLAGNSGTNPGTGVGQNYFGTSDAQDLVLGTNANERLRILSNGQVSINDATPFGADRFAVTAATTEYAINGYTDNGVGVYGENNAGVGDGVFGNSSNVGVRGYGAHGAILESGLDGGYGAIAWNTTASGANRTGLLAMGQNLGVLSFPSTGAILYGSGSGGASFASTAGGTGLLGTGNGGGTALSLAGGSGLAGTGTNFGVVGFSTESTSNPTDGNIGSAGGYFSNGHGGFAATAVWYDPPAGGNNNQNFKIVGTGNVSTIVKDVNENPVIMYAPEAPESLFQDYGIGQLNNGEAIIELDPILSKNIRVDEDRPLKVFIQLEGDCNGVYVTNKSSTSFTVKELQGGRSNVSFSWSIVATRADEVFYNGKGEAKISHNSLRFPLAPPPLEIVTQKSIKDNTKKLTNNIEYIAPKKDYKKSND